MWEVFVEEEILKRHANMYNITSQEGNRMLDLIEQLAKRDDPLRMLAGDHTGSPLTYKAIS